MTRCKLRCTTIEAHVGADGTPVWRTAILRPVMGKGEEENKSFWRSTPTGTMSVPAEGRFGGLVFEIGRYYYVDIANDGDQGAVHFIDLAATGQHEGWEPWSLTECQPSGSSAGASVKLNPVSLKGQHLGGDINLQIDNPYAAAPFARDGMAAYLERCAIYERHVSAGGDVWTARYPDRPAYAVRVTLAA